MYTKKKAREAEPGIDEAVVDPNEEEFDDGDTINEGKVEDFTTFESMEFIKFSVPIFQKDNFGGLSSGALKLWLILSTRLRPDGRVAIEIKDVPKYARKFKQDPKTTKKAFEELLKYTFTVGKGKNTRTNCVLKIEHIDNEVEYLKIPYGSGIGTFDGTGKEYAYPQFIKWQRERLEALLMTSGGSMLATLLAIGIHVNSMGIAFPAWKTIAKIQGVSVSVIGDNLKMLEDADLIKRKLVPGKTQFDHNEYHLDAKTGITFC
ncbi:hypothetical protein [Desulfosporosinus sp. BG]|uniref:hypothetical protein n=1 Tax=Desulfosporosinus sp. BG TaxID=1633135 RepID=UPI00083AE1C2|nr:hypothetical protein [Desulfosporosinus sp. BG]ODA41238.1 hypothetical protein DSBG_2009 [Desulfosporosinus sp. BG]